MHTPLLGTLMGAYFHQDWADDGDEEATVLQFLAENPGSDGITSEINQVLSSIPVDAEVGQYLRGLGSCYRPGPYEGGYRGWLASIANRATDFERGGTES